MEWKKLQTLVNRKIGYGVVQPGESVSGGIPVIKVNNIISGLTDVSKLDTTKPEIAAKYQRTKLNGGELVISVVGTYGKTAIVPKSFAGCNLVRATCLIDIEDESLCEWVKYYIDSPQGQGYINNNLNTTVQATLNVKSLNEMPIPFYSSFYMKKAVSILSSLDRKIELNNKINAQLEEMAQAIFKSWFVDFTPFKDGKFVESELGMIPEGWKVSTLGDFLPVKTGKKDANIASKSGVYPFFSCSQEILYTTNYSFDGSAILVAGNGDFNVKWYDGKFEAYQRTYVLMPYSPLMTHFLYYAIKYYLAQITSAARGSVIKFITKGNLENFKIALPESIDTDHIIEVFHSINMQIMANKRESINLAQLRDTLLPKLMSGEIDLDEIEKTI